MPLTGAFFQTFTACCVTAVLAFLQHYRVEPLVNAELAVADILARAGRKAAADPSLVFLAIDNASADIDAGIDLHGTADSAPFFDLREADRASVRALELMSGGWPWSRAVHAIVLEKLMRAGAKIVVFDLLFTKETPDDPEFRAQLDAFRERVVVISNFVPDSGRLGDKAHLTHQMPTDSLIPHTTLRDDRIGYDNFWPDHDEITRAAQLRLTSRELYPGSSNKDHYLSLAALTAMKAGFGAHVPDDVDEHRFRFAGPQRTFSPQSIFEIFVPAYWRAQYHDGAFFKDKIVVIGASGNWQQDYHLTPLGDMPGAELHLNALNALLGRSFIHQPSEPASALIVAGAGFAAWFLWLLLRRPTPRFLGLLGLALGTPALALWLWNCANLLVPVIAPLSTLAIIGIAGLVSDVVAERKEKTRVRRTLERYVSRNVVKEMMDNPAAFQAALGGVVKPATILFSDIRNFTQVSARIEPHALVEQLNEYLGAMVDCVFRHGGTLDKFIGDAIMAVWGNARSDGAVTDALQAVRCALAMRDELGRLNARWRAEGRNQLEVGIALNHGNVIAGNIGSPHRMEFTVIGDAVNVSWKLQERTKLHSCELLVGKNVADLIGPEFQTQEVGILLVADGVTTRYSRLITANAPGAAEPDQVSSTKEEADAVLGR